MTYRDLAIIAACAATTIATSASAHGIWFAQRARELALVYGEGADDLDAVKRLPMITSVTGYAADWAPVETTFRVAGPIPVIDNKQPVAAVAAIMDYGLWSRGKDGKWHNMGRDRIARCRVSRAQLEIRGASEIAPDQPSAAVCRAHAATRASGY